MDQNFIENELIILSKQTLDLFLAQKNSSDLIAVYTFYYYTAKWQKTNQVKATDNYVMKGLHIGKKTFGEAKKFLLENGLISSVSTKDNKGAITGWYIKINYIWKAKNLPEMEVTQNPQNPPSGKQETNALSANSLNALNANIITTKSEMDMVSVLPMNRGKTAIMRVLSIYQDLFRNKYGFGCSVPIGRFGKSVNTLLKTHTEIQIAALMIIFFDWHGMTGSDIADHTKLLKATFNVFWFFSSITTYEAYARNVLQIKFDDPTSIREFVGEQIGRLSTQ